MRKILSAVTCLALVVSAIPAAAARVAPRQDQTGGVQGVARNAQQQTLANHTVQIRNIQTGQLTASGTTNSLGQFTFAGLNPGNYIVEIVNAAGNIIGTAPVAVAAGTVATVTVSATAIGALAAAGAGGFSVLGLGTAASAAVVGALAVGVTAAVVSARVDASPSR